VLHHNRPTLDAEQFAEDALRLKPPARTSRADCLTASLPSVTKIDEARDRETPRRVEEIRSGAVRAVPIKSILERALAASCRKK
jgi:hypothetical protein